MPSPIVLPPEWFKQLGHADKISSVADAYSRVPLVFRAARLRAGSLRRIPLYVERNGKKVEDGKWDVPNEKGRIVQPKELIYKTEMALLLSGAGFWLHLRNTSGFEKGLQWLNPFSMQVIYVSHERRFYQVLNAYMTQAVEQYPKNMRGYWTDDEMHMWREYHPLDDVRFGISAAANALQDSQLIFYLTRFASLFFENGGMPITIIPLPPGTSEDTEKEINNWFTRAMSGIRNAFRVLAIRMPAGKDNALQPTLFQPNLKQYETPALREASLEAVSLAFDIPKSLLISHGQRSSSNRATGDMEFRHYLTQTVLPRAEYFQDEMDYFLQEAKSPYRVIFAPEEVTELQEDELQRSQSYNFYVGAGMPHEVAAGVLGIEIPTGAQATWDAFIAKQKQELEAPPVVTGIAPATNPMPQPAIENQQRPKQIAPGEPQPVPRDEAKALIETDLDKWERKVLKRLDRGASAACDFESDVIPAETANAIADRLRIATDAEAVRAVFSEAS